MKTEDRRRKSEIRRRKLKTSWRRIIFFCLLSSIFCLPSCSIPNLEEPECTTARQTVRELYSYHFGDDMKFTRENLKEREKFLSRELFMNLSNRDENAIDYFTATDDYPKAFRVGSCTVAERDKRVNLKVVLFWKTDTRSEQREIPVETINESGKWLVNKVGN